MKNKFIILFVIGLILIITGIAFFFLNPNSSNIGKEGKEESKVLRKILKEEIDHDTAKEIVQFYLDAKDYNIKIVSAKILANNEKGEYLVRVETEANLKDTKDTEIRYFEDGNWEVELPLKKSGIIEEKYTEFWVAEEE